MSGVDKRPLWTWIRSLNASRIFAHVARLTSKVVFTVADLIGDLREVWTGRGSSYIETVIGKEVAVLVIKTHLVYWTAETLGTLVGNLHVFTILRRGTTQVG